MKYAVNIDGIAILTGTLLDGVAARQRIRVALEAIAEDASSYLAEAAPVGVFGKLQSAFAEGGYKITQTKSAITAQYDVAKTAPYAWYVVHGSAPAKWNPGKHLIPWVEAKLGLSDKEAVRVAYAIGRGMMRHGTKGTDFITPVIRANKELWGQILAKAARGDA